jgi:subtilase family serine protease
VVCQSDKGGIITSGGGFSTVYPRPAWQSSVVQSYLNSLGQGATGQGE